jgi:hypothetical protein
MTEVVQIPAFEDFLFVIKITGQKRKCWCYVSAKLGEVRKWLPFSCLVNQTLPLQIGMLPFDDLIL